MKRIEQTKDNMAEIYQKVIYPCFGCAAMVELQMQSMEFLKQELVKEVSNKELSKVLSYEMDRVIKSMKVVSDTLNTTMGEALMGLAPMDFIAEFQNKKLGGERI